MGTNPIIQDLIDLIEAPENGRRASSTSEFANRRETGTSPHGGFDVNRGHAVGGSVSSPVYGIIGSGGGGKFNKTIIHEVDPLTNELTGFDVEILHMKTHFLKPGDQVRPGQQIGLEGDVGADRGASHAHIQVFNGTDPTPLNPLRHLYEYHHPGEAIPELPQLAPYSVPPRHGPRQNPADDPIFQGKLPTPQTTLPGGNPPAPLPPNGQQDQPRAPGAQPQLSPGLPIPDAEGPTSLGGPNGPMPLVPPSPLSGQGKRSDIPRGQTPDATQITAQAIPASWTLPPGGADGLDGVLKYFNSAPSGTTQKLAFADPNALPSSLPGSENDDIVPERRLVSRVVNLSAPALSNAPPLSPGWPDTASGTASPPLAQATSQPLLGIFSGKPMPDWPVPPPIFQPKDQSSPDDDELYRRWMRWLDA